jgi:hypothetical protein
LSEKLPVNLACDSDFHVNRRVLLHAANLRHGTDGFTSPPKEGMLWIFFVRKIRRLRPFFFSYLVLHCSGIGLSIVVCILSYCMLRSGANPRSWVPEANMLTTRPPKPLHEDDSITSRNMSLISNLIFVRAALD